MAPATVTCVKKFTAAFQGDPRVVGEDIDFRPPASVAGKACYLEVVALSVSVENSSGEETQLLNQGAAYGLSLGFPKPNSSTNAIDSGFCAPLRIMGDSANTLVALFNPARATPCPSVVVQVPPGPFSLPVRFFMISTTASDIIGTTSNVALTLSLIYELTPVDETL